MSYKVENTPIESPYEEQVLKSNFWLGFLIGIGVCMIFVGMIVVFLLGQSV